MDNDDITLFLCGDVMTGRGIDQVLPYPSDPRLYESYVRDASQYVEIAEQANGPIPKPVDFAYIWGDALNEMARADARIINLETSVTTSNEYEGGKGINYRMHPKNIPAISAAGIDCCVLANNHVLDWGHEGLAETLNTLSKAHIKTSGAGNNLAEAQAPAVLEIGGKGRVLVFSFGLESSGIPSYWAAKADRPGVNLLDDLSTATVRQISKQVLAVKRAGDIVVASIHWGGNWGYPVPSEHQQFAHQLIDNAAVDIIHGHSSHHFKGIEVYKDKPVIYGCGDFLNDYEGIEGYEHYRDDLALMYFVRMAPDTGKLVRMIMAPRQIRRFRSNRVAEEDVFWVQHVLNREGKPFAAGVEVTTDKRLLLRW
ncbi:MAG: CapA family protein [Gammaproteobacteria bacterium]|nr:CapA family protein [Gammaproteobacteria bacterium]